MDFYGQPSMNISNCVSIKLIERNYLLWKRQFESFLAGQSLLGFINGAIKKPPATLHMPNLEEEVQNPDYTAWNRSDQVVRSWVLGSLSEDILSVVVGSNSAQ